MTGSEGWESGTALSPREKVQTQPVLGRAQGWGGRVAGGEVAAGRGRLHRSVYLFHIMLIGWGDLVPGETRVRPCDLLIS